MGPVKRTVFLLAALAITQAALLAAGDGKKDAMPTLEDAFRKWDRGFSSDKKEERLQTLRSMFPTKKELAHLFPKHVDKLWPKFEEGHKFLEENVDRLAKEMTKGGAIKKIEGIDMRREKNPPSGYKALLAILPKDVQVFEVVVRRADSSAGGGTYLFIKDRWFWIRDLDTIPEALDKLK